MKRFLGGILLLLILVNTVSGAELQPDPELAAGNAHFSTGVDYNVLGDESCQVTVNGQDNTKYDINPCFYHLKGNRYAFEALSGIPNGFGTGENSRYIGATTQGTYTTQTAKWSNDQIFNVVPIARINAQAGDTGPTSVISAIRSDRNILSQRNTLDMMWKMQAIGANYVTGGEIFENATTGLVMGQNSGILFDGLGNLQELNSFGNVSAVFLHLSSNEVNWVGILQPFVIDAVNYNPAGSGLVPLLNDNKLRADTVLKSPKEDGRLFVIYGKEQFDTAEEAIAAATDYGLFMNQGLSGLVPVVLIVQQKNGTNVYSIIDRRQCNVCRPQ